MRFGTMYRIEEEIVKANLTRKFIFLFDNDPVDCGGCEYLCDVIKSTSTNILTVKPRRARNGELIKANMPEDGTVDRNFLFLEHLIFDWAEEKLNQTNSISRIEIEILAKDSLLTKTKFNTLEDLKKHLKITHPDLKKFQHKMASKHDLCYGFEEQELSVFHQQ